MPKAVTFQDILNNNFMKSKEFEGVTPSQILIALAFAFLAGMLIYLVYRASSNSAMFVNSFAVSLVGLTMITTIVIMTITSNILLSLGMVGALSIVRFRTAVKEAIDIVFMFFAIAVGIAIGAGFYFIATVSVVIIGIILFAMSKLTTNENAYVLVITANGEVAQANLEGAFKNKVRRSQFKAKSSHQGCLEYTYEVRLQKNNSSFTEELTKISGVQGVSLVGFKTQNYL